MILLSALLAAFAASLALTPRAPKRRIVARPKPSADRSMTDGMTYTAVGVACLGAFLVFGGLLGILAAIVIAVVIPRLLKSITHAKEIATRTELIRQAPEVADMLSATLAAGTPLTTAVATIGRSMSDPAGGVFREIAHGTDLGADPEQAWTPALTQDALAPIAHAVLRATLSGASLSDVLLGVADDARRRHQALVEIAARTAGVKAVAPLAACFLPAFILLGVVPTVVALAGEIF